MSGPVCGVSAAHSECIKIAKGWIPRVEETMAASGLLKALFDPMRMCLLFAFPESGALLLVAAVEKRSARPLAEAILERACELGIE